MFHLCLGLDVIQWYYAFFVIPCVCILIAHNTHSHTHSENVVGCKIQFSPSFRFRSRRVLRNAPAVPQWRHRVPSLRRWIRMLGIRWRWRGRMEMGRLLSKTVTVGLLWTECCDKMYVLFSVSTSLFGLVSCLEYFLSLSFVCHVWFMTSCYIW